MKSGDPGGQSPLGKQAAMDRWEHLQKLVELYK